MAEDADGSVGDGDVIDDDDELRTPGMPTGVGHEWYRGAVDEHDVDAVFDVTDEGDEIEAEKIV